MHADMKVRVGQFQLDPTGFAVLLDPGSDRNRGGRGIFARRPRTRPASTRRKSPGCPWPGRFATGDGPAAQTAARARSRNQRVVMVALASSVRDGMVETRRIRFDRRKSKGEGGFWAHSACIKEQEWTQLMQSLYFTYPARHSCRPSHLLRFAVCLCPASCSWDINGQHVEVREDRLVWVMGSALAARAYLLTGLPSARDNGKPSWPGCWPHGRNSLQQRPHL